MSEASVVARKQRLLPAEHYRQAVFGMQRAPRERQDDLVPPVRLGRAVSRVPSPAWRFEEALMIRQNISNPDEFARQAGRQHDVLLVKHVVPFLHAYQQRGNDYFRAQKVREQWPELVWAYSVYNDQTNKMQRYFLEALVLGGAPEVAIAKMICVPEVNIWWYEKVFFDVRNELDKGEWVPLYVLFPILQQIDKWHVQNFLWKVLCWNEAVSWTQFVELVHYGNKTPECCRLAILNLLNLKMMTDTFAAVAARTPNRFNENFIMDQYLKIIELEKDMGRDNAQTQDGKLVRQLIDSLKGSFTMAAAQSTSLGVEPRAQQQYVNVFRDRLRERETLAKAVGDSQ